MYRWEHVHQKPINLIEIKGLLNNEPVGAIYNYDQIDQLLLAEDLIIRLVKDEYESPTVHR